MKEKELEKYSNAVHVRTKNEMILLSIPLEFLI